MKMNRKNHIHQFNPRIFGFHESNRNIPMFALKCSLSDTSKNLRSFFKF